MTIMSRSFIVLSLAVACTPGSEDPVEAGSSTGSSTDSSATGSASTDSDPTDASSTTGPGGQDSTTGAEQGSSSGGRNTITVCRDFDGDGFGDGEDCVDTVGEMRGYVEDDTDCVDTEATVFPGAALEEPSLCSVDADGDGYASATASVRFLGAQDGSDCDDIDPNIHAGCLCGTPATQMVLTSSFSVNAPWALGGGALWDAVNELLFVFSYDVVRAYTIDGTNMVNMALPQQFLDAFPPGQTAVPSAAAYDPATGDAWLTSVSGGLLRFDLETWTLLDAWDLTTLGLPAWVHGLALMPSGDLLVSAYTGSEDDMWRIDVSGGAPVLVDSADVVPFGFSSIVPLSDGEFLVGDLGESTARVDAQLQLTSPLMAVTDPAAAATGDLPSAPGIGGFVAAASVCSTGQVILCQFGFRPASACGVYTRGDGLEFDACACGG